jgi:pimeloyl-ACP methyl ester carboxylesterase
VTGIGESRIVVSADGTTLSCAVAGHGPALIIMPGTLTVPQMYLPLVALLARRYTVTLVSRRGYGSTERGPSPCSLAAQAQDLAAVLRGVGEPAVVFGHSFGGVIALSAALTESARIARLVLYEPPLALLGAQLRPMLARCRDAVAAGKPTTALRYAFRVSGSPDVGEATVPERALTRLASGVDGLLADLECVTGVPGPSPEWAALPVPVALVQGERSTEPYPRSMRALRALFPAAPSLVLPGQTHFPDDMTLLEEAIDARIR